MTAEMPPYNLYKTKPEIHLYVDCVKSPIFTYIKSVDKPDSGIIYSFLENKFKLDNDLKEIVNILTKSEKMLSLEDNWDDMGSPSISVEAWRSTAWFLIGYSKKVFKDYGYVIDIPKIYPSSDGSIDIAWDTETYGFMINIDSSGEEANYYVDNKGEQMSQGKFNPRDFDTHRLPKAISF